MAIKPPNQTKLSTEQVLQIRKEYFLNRVRMEGLAEKYQVSKALIQKAVHAEGRFSSITDNIPKEVKETRMTQGQYRKSRKTQQNNDILARTFNKQHAADSDKKEKQREYTRKSREKAKQQKRLVNDPLYFYNGQ